MYTCTFCNIISNENNSTKIADMDHSIALLNFNQVYRGRCLVILRQHYDDPLKIPADIFHLLNTEMMAVARAVERAFSPDRMNYAILGNTVSHVHWHIIPRYRNDPSGRYAPWQMPDKKILSETENCKLIELIKYFLKNAL
jgi:diadenosine tetraphosphate (Ap4A) HIT family hydrolase